MQKDSASDLARLTITHREWLDRSVCDLPALFVDLTRAVEAQERFDPPPCPVIGIGESAHPFASLFDAVIEPPIAAAAIARQVISQPEAAAVTVQVLRSLPDLDAAQGLVAESIAYGLLQGSRGHREWLAARGPMVAETPGKVVLERSENVLTIILDRPLAANAIDRAMRDELYEAFALAELDRDIDAILLRATGPSFSLGADLTEFGTTTDPATAHAIRMQTLPAHKIARCANRLDVHVQGACVGAGLEMAAWASRFTASSDAWFQLPELSMGILPGAGGCVSLSRRIGRQRTALLILSGKRISARTALDWGLIDAIVDEPA